MLVSCPPNCKLKKVTTDASLNLDTNEVQCNDCGECIQVSKFAKASMKLQKDVIQKKKKAFMFDCKKCDKRVQATKIGGVVVGKECDNNQNGCMLDITEAMKMAVSEEDQSDE